MEISFQNEQADLEAYLNYWCRQLADGKKYIRQAFLRIQGFIILSSLLIFLSAGIGQIPIFIAMLAAVLIFLITEAVILLRANFKPFEYMATRFSRKQAAGLVAMEMQSYRLPKKLSMDDDWLEIQSSEAQNRYRWNLVSQIGLSADHIFIQIGRGIIFNVPRRAFASQQSFDEFGKELTTLYEKNKTRTIGA